MDTPSAGTGQPSLALVRVGHPPQAREEKDASSSERLEYYQGDADVRPVHGKVKELAETGLYDRRLRRPESQRGNSLDLQYNIDPAAVRRALLTVVLMTTALVLRSRMTLTDHVRF